MPSPRKRIQGASVHPSPTNADDGEVGYGKPPKATRFTKGQSGNPRGRPKGTRNVMTAFRAALSEQVVISEHGKRRTVSKLEATAMQLANKAASGDARAINAVLAIAPLLDLVVETPASSKEVADRDQHILKQLLQRMKGKS